MPAYLANSFARVCLAGVSIIALSTPVFAQEATSDDVAAVNEDAPSGEILVVARRRAENLQDVPQTVNVVTSEVIEKLRINSAADVASVVPGIIIEGGSTGSGQFGASSGIRGVPTFATANANPVVQFYLNDAPTGNSPGVTQLLYDIGQIEVLKGPQGTLRGRSAPTGAITFTTRRPDLETIGGTINLSGSHRNNINAQAAFGVPIIPGVLAIRLAGAVDHSEGSGVRSANTGVDPYVRAEGLRGSVRFEPTSTITANIMYQHLWRKTRSYTQLVGPGSGLNGPVITPEDRLGITDRPSEADNRVDFLVGQADWRFGGQKLSYVGAYRLDTLASASPQDAANVIRGGEYFQTVNNRSEEQTHELRLASEDRIVGVFDYVVGGFFNKTNGQSIVVNPSRYLSGAFGRPGTAPQAVNPDPRYSLSTTIQIKSEWIEKSVFGSITAHLGDKTELAAGGRYVHYTRDDQFAINLVGGFNGVGVSNCANVPGSVPSPVYPGTCDVPIPGSNIQNERRQTKFTPFLYNISLSHKFTPDFMVYGNVGSAFRSAGPRIGFTSPIICCASAGGPTLAPIDDLVFQNEERSKSYEIGFKATFLNRRARLNVALFKQNFNNFYFQTQSVQYLSISTPANPAGAGGASVSNAEFTAGADASVKGIDVEAAFQVTPRWNVSVAMTWSDTKLKNALIPCNDSDFNGIPDSGVATVAGFLANNVIVARCASNEAISRSPAWNLNIQSEYRAPLSEKTEAFIRGNFNYYPDNPNASQGVVIGKYSILNAYIGLRGQDGAWELNVFANNLLNTQQVLARNALQPTSAAAINTFPQLGGAGYNQIGYTPRREFGLQLRYAFGSH